MARELLEVARRAAAAGARTLAGFAGRELAPAEKASRDFVTLADRASEAAVAAVIRQAFPGHAVLAEESAGDFAAARDREGVLWVVDPLDGTTNFIHGYPAYAVSVAALVDGTPVAGVVVDVARGEEFWAAKGSGAFLGERRLAISGQTDPGRSLVLTGFGYGIRDRFEAYLTTLREAYHATSGVRRGGAAALDLAYLAAGRAEGFWELGLFPWDVAAGALLVREAGGVVSDFTEGGEGFLWKRQVVAGNAACHAFLLAICRRSLA